MSYQQFQFTISTPDTESKTYSIRLHPGLLDTWHCIQYVNEAGEPHREDGPAEIYKDGDEFWYRDGERIKKPMKQLQENPIRVTTKTRGWKIETYFCDDHLDGYWYTMIDSGEGSVSDSYELAMKKHLAYAWHVTFGHGDLPEVT